MKSSREPSSETNTVSIEFRIDTSNPDPRTVIDRAKRELELAFGDNVTVGWVEIKPKKG